MHWIDITHYDSYMQYIFLPNILCVKLPYNILKNVSTYAKSFFESLGYKFEGLPPGWFGSVGKKNDNSLKVHV